MKKGFTLVELMGIIVILCIILLMSVPAISNTLKTQEDQEYKRFEESLCIGTKAYMRHNASKYESFFDNKGRTTVCAKEVYKSGYVSSELTNPKTNTVECTAVITVKYNDNGDFSCEYSLDESICPNTNCTVTSISSINSNLNSNAVIDDPSNVNG